MTVEQARTLQRDNNEAACRDAITKTQAAGVTVPANMLLLVAQPAGTATQPAGPAVKVEQAPPQVTVQQSEPQVTVRQPQPEITVHQPAPTVTVDIPQPEITIKMPPPDVQVSQAQPQVSVNQAKPQVQVVQPAAPQVQVQAAQPNVQVQRSADSQPNVTVQPTDGKPTIKYDREEPKVVVNQAKGDPNINVQQSGGANATDAATGAAQSRVAANQAPAAVVPPVGVPAVVAPRAATTGGGVTVAQLNALNLYNAQGNELGDVEHVIRGQDGKTSIVIGHGGFLGLGEKQVAIPLEQVAMRGDRLVIQGVTDEQIKAMPAWSASAGNFTELPGSQSVPVSAIQ